MDDDDYLPTAKIMEQALLGITDELARTYSRVETGEFPPIEARGDAFRVCLLVEELGEIAELVKVRQGAKPKSALNRLDDAQMRQSLKTELTQLASIAVDWVIHL